MKEFARPEGEVADEVHQFAYSPWTKVSAFLDIVFSLLFSCFFLLIATYVAGDVHGFILWAGILVMYYCAAVFLSRAFLRLKYLHVLGSRYVVGHDGISVHMDGRQRHLKWDELATSDYLPLVPLYRLSADALSRPIVLFMIGNLMPNSAVNRRNKLAATVLKDKLGPRLRTRWLLW